MTEDARTRMTDMLTRLTERDAALSPEDLLPLVYEDMRRLAVSYMRRERPDHTLRPTDVVHEAYVRLVDQTRVDWQGRTHFFAVGAQAMRRLLIDHARRHARDKHGGSLQKVQLDGIGEFAAEGGLSIDELLALDRALDELAELDPRQARVVEMRSFAGLKVDEIAVALNVSRRTIEGDWTHARAWLRRRLSDG